tara:strand:+ start:9890 stop:10423 length:534 start_codon:yes stop_codon:yes gene_type:complete
MKQSDYVLPANKTKTFLKKGYDKYCDTALQIISEVYECEVASSSTSKYEKAWIDAVLIRDGEVKACVEIKSRNMNFELLKQRGSLMISADKINKGTMISARAFEVPFFVFAVLIPDKRLFFWKVSDEKGNFLMPLKMESRKTPFNCAGGERIENVAHLPLDKMREVYFPPEKYFMSL